MKRQRGGSDDSADLLGQVADQVSNAVVLSFPGGTSENETYYEPYTPAVGPVDNITPITKKKKKPALGPVTNEQVEENKRRKRRYDTFIDHLVDKGGDTVAALAATYGVPDAEIRENLADYKADVALGMSQSSVGDLLEEAGLGKAVRVAILKKHAFDPDARPSLAALKLALDLTNDTHDHGQGSYEKYLQMTMARK